MQTPRNSSADRLVARLDSPAVLVPHRDRLGIENVAAAGRTRHVASEMSR